jgi:hypothetical protein
MRLQPVKYIRSKLASGVDQILRVFFTNHADSFINRLGSQARTAFDVIGGFGPRVAQCVAQGIDDVLVMALAFAHSVARVSKRDHAELQGRVVGVLKPAIGLVALANGD